MLGFSQHGEEMFCPSSPSDVHGMRNPLSFKEHVCPHHLYSHSARWQHILKHIWLICTHRYLPCIYWEKPVLRAVSFHSLFPPALPVPLSKILQNSTAPSVILGIMGRCREAKGMMLLMLVSGPPDGSLDVFDSFNQFCAKTQVFSFADSSFKAIEALTM